MQQLTPASRASDTDDGFVRLLPVIQCVVRTRLQRYSAQDREELTAEAVAAAYVMFCRLVEQGRSELAYATPLGLYGVRQALAGRRVGTPMNLRDVTSRYCQRRRSVKMQPLDQFDPATNRWMELVVEDRASTPADVAATRIDFRAWLGTLTRRRRRIAETLAGGESTTATAKKFRLTPGRISQLRRELLNAWRAFQGELVPQGT